MQAPPAEVGTSIREIDTPALIVDLDAFERNLDKMAGIAATTGVRLRPHAKTHRCSEVARQQIARGAVGQCVQKVGEAEALAAGGVGDILVSNQVVGETKLRRLAALAERTTVALCFDAEASVEAASRAAAERGVQIGGLVEIEVGMERCGVLPGRDARDLARRIADAPGLRFEGLQAYHGGAQHMTGFAERRAAIDGAVRAVRETLEMLEADGLPCPLVGGAGTGTFRLEAASGIYTELQPGSYAFMDAEYAGIADEGGGPNREFEHSLFVLAAVMSAGHGRAILDAGLKSYSAEKGLPWVHGRPGLEVVSASDEHSKLVLGAEDPAFRLGDRVQLIPGHCDPTVNLHDWYVGVRRGVVEAVWPIDARGASR